MLLAFKNVEGLNPWLDDPNKPTPQGRHMGGHTKPTLQSQPAQEPVLPYTRQNHSVRHRPKRRRPTEKRVFVQHGYCQNAGWRKPCFNFLSIVHLHIQL